MNAKRWGAVLVALGFLAALFGCSNDPSKHGDWTSFHMNRISSVMTDAYHFGIMQESDGEMSMTGYCYDDDGTEYRAEGIFLPYSIKAILHELQPQSLPTAKKKSSSAGQKLDGTSCTETVTHEDGTERAVALTQEQRDVLTDLFADALMAAVQSASHGEWKHLSLYFSNDNYSEGYSFDVFREAEDTWLARGYCSVYDEENGGYREYVSEDGFVLDTATVEAIAALGLERYPAMQTTDPDSNLPEILDGSLGGLTLGFADGFQQNKATPSSVDDAIAGLLKREFAQKAVPQ